MGSPACPSYPQTPNPCSVHPLAASQEHFGVLSIPAGCWLIFAREVAGPSLTLFILLLFFFSHSAHATNPTGGKGEKEEGSHGHQAKIPWCRSRAPPAACLLLKPLQQACSPSASGKDGLGGEKIFLLHPCAAMESRGSPLPAFPRPAEDAHGFGAPPPCWLGSEPPASPSPASPRRCRGGRRGAITALCCKY